MRLIHLLTEAGTMFNRILLLGPAALLAAACSIDRPYPTDASVAANTSVAFSAVKFWDAGATVGWNQLATDLTTAAPAPGIRSEEHTSELQSQSNLVCRLLLEKKQIQLHRQSGTRWKQSLRPRNTALR